MTDPRRPIFDAVRHSAPAGLFNDAGNVLALDNLLDTFGVPRDDTALTISDAGLQLIRQFEGCAKRLQDGGIQAYPDPGTGGAPWTIGWGSTTDEDGKPIAPGTIWTQDRADARFARHVADFAIEIADQLDGSRTTQPQFDALVSLAYNIGVRALETSTLLRLHKAGDHATAAAQFGRWNRAGGRVLAGLTRRRTAEAELYRSNP